MLAQTLITTTGSKHENGKIQKNLKFVWAGLTGVSLFVIVKNDTNCIICIQGLNAMTMKLRLQTCV